MVFPTEYVMNEYNLFWQYPVITEETFYNQNKTDEKYIGLPWATIIDKKMYDATIIYQIIKHYMEYIDSTNSNNSNSNNNTSTTPYYTCCQHIHFRYLIDFFKELNINIIYTPHKLINEDTINDISIKACPLYAANIEDEHRNQIFKNINFLNSQRKYLYSFQGAYDKQWYLTNIREQLFNMKHPDDCYVKNIGIWHYNNIVYSTLQNKEKELNENNTHINNTIDYNKLLLESRFSLCPSGSGPNSIRLWESLAVGSIPIILADTLELPKHELWDKSIIRVKESDVSKILEIISLINENKEKEMRKNCIELYNYFKNNYKNDQNDQNDNKISIEIIPIDIIHYCCGSYEIGDFGGVARYDYHIKLAFPNRKFFKGPEQKLQMLKYLNNSSNCIVITDNHLVCDIPNKYKTFLVHHGVAKTHAEREPDWNPYWKNLCCFGQANMLEYRDTLTTTIISISQFCTDEFTKYYDNLYKKFNNIKILHASELNSNSNGSIYKTNWNTKPIVLGNWKDKNKGSLIIEKLRNTNTNTSNKFIFKILNTYPYNQNEITGEITCEINEWNKRKQDIYLSSDIFLQLSLCEGNSYATLDALLCGIPVISSDVGIFYKDVPEDCFVKIDWRRNNDLNYIEEKLNYAWENKEILSKKGREWYLNNCELNNWISVMRNTIL